MRSHILSALLAMLIALPLSLVTSPSQAEACGNPTRLISRDVYTVRTMAWNLNHERYKTVIKDGIKMFPKLQPSSVALENKEKLHESLKGLKSIERRALRYMAIATLRAKGSLTVSMVAEPATTSQAKQNTTWALNALEYIVSKNKKYQGYLAEALAYFNPERHEEALKIFAKLEKRRRIYGGYTYFAYASLLEAKGDTELAQKMRTKGEKKRKRELASRKPSRETRYSRRIHKRGIGSLRSW